MKLITYKIHGINFIYYALYYFHENDDVWHPVCDFLNYSDEKGEMVYPAFLYISEPWYHSFIVGRGYNGNYAVEPMYFHNLEDYDEKEPVDIVVPGLEVNVVVHVKMKGIEQPFVYVRNYLPELKSVTMDEFAKQVENIKNHQLDSKQNGHHASYDYQVKRISGAIEAMKDMFAK